jgi:O-antigen chain-terminating bifunctional methyltransferase/kinase
MNTDKIPSPVLKQLVTKLPEQYQPIYGFETHFSGPSRISDDRLAVVMRVYDGLANRLGRPIRVLDMGCAQGYFSLALAARGAVVTGWDYNAENVDVCNQLATETLDTETQRVKFRHCSIADMVSEVAQESYDLVLALSVFHHVAFDLGFAQARDLLGKFVLPGTALVGEIALHSEPLYWASAQPVDPRDWFAKFAFSHQLATSSTHLSSVARPIYFASDSLVSFGQDVYGFERVTHLSHHLAGAVHQGTRRYYTSNQHVIKVFQKDSKELGVANADEISAEAGFLRAPPPGGRFPEVLEFGSDLTRIWLVRKALAGELLLDKFRRGERVDSYQVVVQVLEQLSLLEEAGLYHRDVRTWNIVVDSDGVAQLIDYGSISRNRSDCAWPHDPFLSFFIFVKEVAHGLVGVPLPIRLPYVSPCSLPYPFSKWEHTVWHAPRKDVSFRKLLDVLLSKDAVNPVTLAGKTESLNHLWVCAVEEALEKKLFHAIEVDSTRMKFADLTGKISEQTEAIRTLAHQEKTLKESLEAANAELVAQTKSASLQNIHMDALLAESESMRKLISEHEGSLDTLRDALERSRQDALIAKNQLDFERIARENALIELERLRSSTGREMTELRRTVDIADGSRRTSEWFIEQLTGELEEMSKARRGILDSHLDLEERARTLTKELVEVKQAAVAAEAQVESLLIQRQVQMNHIAKADEFARALVTSKSWRMTEPLRRAMGLLKRLLHKIRRVARVSARAIATSTFGRWIVRLAVRHKGLRRLALTIASILGLKDMLTRVYETQRVLLQPSLQLVAESNDPNPVVPITREYELTVEQKAWLTSISKT